MHKANTTAPGEKGRCERHRRRLLIVATALAQLGACTSYQPRPLEETALAASVAELRLDAPAPLKEWAGRHRFDASDGLDLDEVATLAVINNPDLKARRAQLSVSGAQVFAAGLLPDPQFDAGLDKPTGNSDNSGLVNAWILSLGYDIVPLITRQARIDAESGAQRKVRLDLLWQEWQVVQKSRSLAVALDLEEQRRALLNTMLEFYRQRYEHSAAALAQGDSTLDVNGTDLTAVLDTLSQINQLEQTHNQTRHDFNLLLGLQPQAQVALAPLPQDLPPAAETVRPQLKDLPRRRPDLLALQAGYASQEARVRAAVLAQFPSLGISVNSARDTSDVRTIGLGVSLTLPLFSGNRGNIAIERATREQLQEEYRARLAQAYADVDMLLSLQTILRQQQDKLQLYLPRLEKLVGGARRAYDRGDIEAVSYLNMEVTWMNKRLEQLSLLQASWENRIALDALLAMPDYPEAGQTAAEKPLRSVP
jgi:outer membrane protein, heavy metal efflux system